MATLFGGRFLLGLGVSHVPLVEEVRGHQYRRPVATMRVYLDAMDKAGAIAPPPEESPPTVLAALGPQMTVLAAERTAGALSYNVTPDHTAQTREIIGPDKWLCVEQKVLLVTDPIKARAVARQTMAFYLPLTNYRQNWHRLGFHEEDLADGGATGFWTPWWPGGMRRRSDNVSRRISMREPATSASRPCTPTGSPCRTSRRWLPSRPRVHERRRAGGRPTAVRGHGWSSSRPCAEPLWVPKTRCNRQSAD